MADVCIACGHCFEKKAKGYKRYRTSVELNGQSIASLLSQYSVGVPGPENVSHFICTRCFQQLKTISKHENIFMGRCGKRKDGPKSPIMVKIILLLVALFFLLVVNFLFIFLFQGYTMRLVGSRTKTPPLSLSPLSLSKPYLH